MTCENVGKCYGNKRIFGNANFMIERGEKIAFVGKNGEGKSTLVKSIMREIEHEGKLTIGHNVKISYLLKIKLHYWMTTSQFTKPSTILQ